MPHETLLILLAVPAGLLLGAAIAFLAPRLAAYRLEETKPLPGWKVLIPLVGGRLAGWEPVRTAILEVFTAFVLAALAMHYGNDPRLYLAGLYTLFLIAISYVDVKHRLVLNRLSYPGIVLALAGGALWPGLSFLNALIGAAIALALFALLEFLGRGALGTGDTKLAVLIGAMRGFPGVFDALFLGVALGGMASLFFLFVLRRGRKDAIAYAPYLAAGAVLSFFLISP